MIEPLSITFVNNGYIPIGLNWIKRARAVRPQSSIRVIALDEAAKQAFDQDVVLFRPLGGTELADLWTHRIGVFLELLEDGFDIVHSDSDAIWVCDPIPHVLSSNVDMAFSQGTIWPPDVHAKHQVVVCCGFFYLKSKEIVCDFMREVGRRIVNDRDDQASINRLIDEMGVEWRFDTYYEIPFRKTVFRASQQPIVSRINSLPSLSVLPHHLFPRLFETVTPESVVAHPLTPKTCEAKIEALSRLGLWDL